MTDEILLDCEDRMDKAVVSYEHVLETVRTGRASTALVEHLHVSHYGQAMPLNQLATLAAPEAQLITVTPWDKGAINSIMKAIQTSDLGINPSNDGVIIRLPIPPLTEERRKDLAKLAGKYAEQQRIAVRNVRRDGMDTLKAAEKKSDISQDDQKRLEAEVQKITDEAIKRIDEALKTKEQEIMQV